MGVYYINDDTLGRILIHTRIGMKCVRSRIKDGLIELHVPQGISPDELRKIIDANRDKLNQILARNEEKRLTYHAGQVINCLGGSTITIGVQDKFPDKAIFGKDDTGNLYVNVASNMDLSDENVVSLISRCLKSLAKRLAPQVVIKYAQDVATEIGARPSRFVIGSGLRKLGHCTRTREIQLSYNIVFLPSHLARFIILHEITHLTHFNHSPEFHALLNSYCGGNEKALINELKHFPWPVKL